MAGRDYKPLPGMRNLRRAIICVLNDHRLKEPATATVQVDEIAALAGVLDAALALESGMALSVLGSLAGLPRDPEVWRVAIGRMARWAPALRAGYAYSPAVQLGAGRVPHKVLVENPEPVPEANRWNIRMAVEDGPLAGTVSDLQISHRMACSLLICATGIRNTYRTGVARPYDLHGLRVLILPAESSRGRIMIGRALHCKHLIRANGSYRMRAADCRDGTVRGVCIDCGKSAEECPLARRSFKAPVSRCVCCGGSPRPTTRTGVCFECLNRSTTLGVPLARRPSN